jgi:hypothetical protein
MGYDSSGLYTTFPGTSGYLSWYTSYDANDEIDFQSVGGIDHSRSRAWWTLDSSHNGKTIKALEVICESAVLASSGVPSACVSIRATGAVGYGPTRDPDDLTYSNITDVAGVSRPVEVSGGKGFYRKWYVSGNFGTVRSDYSVFAVKYDPRKYAPLAFYSSTSSYLIWRSYNMAWMTVSAVYVE